MGVADDVCGILRARLRRPLSEGRVIEPHDRLDELGVDSISIAFVFAHFEQQHDVSFDNDELNPRRYETIMELAAAVERRVSPPRP